MLLTRDPALAEDIVQEAYVRAWESSKTPHDADGFRRWLYKIMLNLIRDHRRRERRRNGIQPMGHGQTDPAAEAERLLEQSRLAAAIDRLSARERDLIILRFFEGAEYSEVARVFGTRTVVLRVLMHRTLRKLRRDLESTRSLEVSQTA